MLRPKRSFVVVGILLAALLGGALEGFLPHTDDGCPTEIHCLTCRTVQGRTAVLAVAVPLLSFAAAAGTAPPPTGAPLAHVDRDPSLSRGPPLSC